MTDIINTAGGAFTLSGATVNNTGVITNSGLGAGAFTLSANLVANVAAANFASCRPESNVNRCAVRATGVGTGRQFNSLIGSRVGWLGW